MCQKLIKLNFEYIIYLCFGSGFTCSNNNRIGDVAVLVAYHINVVFRFI